jgi:hypothetical protein
MTIASSVETDKEFKRRLTAMEQAGLLFAITSMDGRKRPTSAFENFEFEQDVLGRIQVALVDFDRLFPNALKGEQPVDSDNEGYLLDVTVQSNSPQRFAVMNERLGSLLRKRGLSGF